MAKQLRQSTVTLAIVVALGASPGSSWLSAAEEPVRLAQAGEDDVLDSGPPRRVEVWVDDQGNQRMLIDGELDDAFIDLARQHHHDVHVFVDELGNRRVIVHAARGEDLLGLARSQGLDVEVWHGEGSTDTIDGFGPRSPSGYGLDTFDQTAAALLEDLLGQLDAVLGSDIEIDLGALGLDLAGAIELGLEGGDGLRVTVVGGDETVLRIEQENRVPGEVPGTFERRRIRFDDAGLTIEREVVDADGTVIELDVQRFGAASEGP